MARALLAVALAVHLVGIALAAVGELRHREAVARAGALALAAAWLLELATLTAIGLAASAFPLRTGPEYLLVLGWFVLTLHLALWYRSRVRAAALVLPPVAALMVLAGFLLADPPSRTSPLTTQGWFVFHTSIATAGVAALAVSFAMSLLFLVKERALKTKRSLRVLTALPTLEALDRIGFQALLYGFPLLTLGIATGMVYSATVHDHIWIWGAKEIFPVIAWAVFAGLLWARFARGVRGRRSAILAIAGFAFALLTFVGMVR
ncbi:MAG TPA: cytochrome c biogenesis protein CcsA [Candidatus Polarisedimenticolaceae bacterium]|nr:cytochrome c biogenesis protein CcsA [Candidatus Polarisedimenticolaceae bacterium]